MTKHLTRLASLFLILTLLLSLVSCDSESTGKYFLQQEYPYVHVEICRYRNNYILVDTTTGLVVYCDAISDDGQWLLRPQKIFIYPEQYYSSCWTQTSIFFDKKAEKP